MLTDLSRSGHAQSWQNLSKKAGERRELAAGRTVGWPMHYGPILLSGPPRTGTSWTAKVLSRGPNVRYLREPLSHGGCDAGGPHGWFPFLVEGDEAPRYLKLWRGALSLRSLASRRWIMAESQGWLRRVPLWPARLLVKEVNCPLALEWLSESLGFRIVVTIRHPCGFVSSGLRVQKKGFPFVSLDQLLAQPRLVSAYFANDLEWLSRLQRPVEKLAAWYGMVYKVLCEQLGRHPEWLLVRHEGFCADPQAQFERLFDSLGIRFSASAAHYLAATTQRDDGELYSVYRQTSREPEKWKHELSAAQIECVASIVARFDLPVYRGFA